jgi:excinuclease ABC subunit A
MSEHKYITIKGAREHNLENIDIQIPRDRIKSKRGLTGTGKSCQYYKLITRNLDVNVL